MLNLTPTGIAWGKRLTQGLNMLVVVLLALLLVSCGISSKPVEVEKRTKEIKQFHPPSPAPIIPQAPRVVVLTPQVTADLNERGIPYTYFAFSQADYLTFASWLQDVLRYVRQQNEVVEYYRND